MDRVSVFSSTIERWQLRRGDHIYVWRSVYSHHGIYESDEKVIQFTSALPLSSIVDGTCSRCSNAKRGGGVMVCCLNCFLEGGGNELKLFVYSVSWWFYNMSNTGVLQDTCSMEDEDPPETVLRRANELLLRPYLFGFGLSSYDAVVNNCFDFAFYCKTGRRYRLLAEMIVEPSTISAQELRSAIRRWLF